MICTIVSSGSEPVGLLCSRMYRSLQTICRNTLGRKLTSFVLLLSLCASFVPLPAGPAFNPPEKDHSEPFPCQHRACGCRSAKQCWKKCCCFTNEQKVAWAKKNGVKVPAEVLRQLGHDAQLVETTSEKPRSACCSQAAPRRESSQDTSTHKEKSTRYVIGIFAEQCQGNGSSLSSIPLSILPPHVEVVVSLELVALVSADTSLFPPPVTHQPPVPPPRVA